MNRFLYSLLLYLLSPIIWIYFACRGLKDPRYWRDLVERLGYVSKDISKNRLTRSKCIHIHCASVGESRAVIPFTESLGVNYPEVLLLITSTTPTGRNVINKLIRETQSAPAKKNILVCYLPIDWPGACKRFLETIKPSLCVFMETELWPNLIHQIESKSIPIFLANARMSDASMKKYLNHSQLSTPMFASLTHIAAQYEADKKNYLALGCEENRISVVGNVKFDINISNKLRHEQQTLRKLWSADRPCWIAASIHPEEFNTIIDSHQQMLNNIPNLLLIAVPRHSERFSELKNQCKKRRIKFVNRTENSSPTKDQSVVIGDTMDEMMLLFGAADVAFIGGSLIERGGHNPIEAAACGLPVVMGPSVYNFATVCQLMEDDGSLTRIEKGQQLVKVITTLLSHSEDLQEKRQAARKTIAKLSGSIDKQTSIMQNLCL